MECETGAIAGLIGRCPAMDRLRREIARFGPTDLWMHVFGETGSGKELVARALHEVSPRARRDIVPVNVAAVSDELFLPELFGHARGAFTGALDSREGYVAAAEGSTLFIDEVGDMSLTGQARLLRFLEGGEYRRVGEASLRRANIRVISATNVDLERRVQEGRFRDELLFRLRDETIHVPPLRERGEDVLLLARHFLRVQAPRRGENPPALSREVEAALLGYHWPGNVRQLQKEMRRLAVLAAGREVTLEDLSPALQQRPARKAGTLRAALDQCEAEILQDALDRNGGNQTRAAADLGITRQALWAKVRRRGLVAARAGAVLSSRASRGDRSWRRGGRTKSKGGGDPDSGTSPAAGA
ncbi:MAG TPA: sigma-54 dependent transcriptional regulator [Vicinamibacteria bacterium]|nr:sigma-54 dependent transcriptional regulator [Vicinamibacteria bacterium]